MSIADDDRFCCLLDKYTDAVCNIRIDDNMKNLAKGVFAAQELMDYVDSLIEGSGVSWTEFPYLKEKFLDHIDKHIASRMPNN